MDGYTRLLHAVLEKKSADETIERPMICRLCGVGINKSLDGRNGGRICIDCQREKNNEYQRWMYLRNPEQFRQYTRNYALKHPERIKAWGVAHYLYPETQVCSVEGCNRLAHRHHDDYSKPADIKWLCPLHHKELSKV